MGSWHSPSTTRRAFVLPLTQSSQDRHRCPQIFKVSCLVVLLQLAYSAELFHWLPRIQSLTAEPKAVEEIKIGDAMRVVWNELGWLQVPLLVLLVSLVFRRSRNVYLVDFVTFDPPDDWKVSKVARAPEPITPRRVQPSTHLARSPARFSDASVPPPCVCASRLSGGAREHPAQRGRAAAELR